MTAKLADLMMQGRGWHQEEVPQKDWGAVAPVREEVGQRSLNLRTA